MVDHDRRSSSRAFAQFPGNHHRRPDSRRSQQFHGSGQRLLRRYGDTGSFDHGHGPATYHHHHRDARGSGQHRLLPTPHCNRRNRWIPMVRASFRHHCRQALLSIQPERSPARRRPRARATSRSRSKTRPTPPRPRPSASRLTLRVSPLPPHRFPPERSERTTPKCSPPPEARAAISGRSPQAPCPRASLSTPVARSRARQPPPAPAISRSRSKTPRTRPRSRPSASPSIHRLSRSRPHLFPPE